MLLKLTLVSDEGAYIIVAQPKATSYGRTFTVNGRAFTFRHLRCRVERAVRAHSLRAWAIGRAQMAIPSKECTLLHTIYNIIKLARCTPGPLSEARCDPTEHTH